MDYHFESDIQKMTLKKLSRMFKETSQLKVYTWFFITKRLQLWNNGNKCRIKSWVNVLMVDSKCRFELCNSEF